MKTITVQGKVYQIGKLYSCSDSYMHGYLRAHSASNDSFILSSCPRLGDRHVTSREIDVVGGLGTITDAPVELVDGEWYMCFHKNANFVGCYNSDSTRMESGEVEYLTGTYNPLYRMVKA